MTLHELLSQRYLTCIDIPPLVDIARIFMAGTKFEDAWVVNAQSAPGQLGIYFCNFENDGPLSMFLNNCTYVSSSGDWHSILCDVQFLTDPNVPLADPRQLDPSNPELEQPGVNKHYEEMGRKHFVQNLEQFFPSWVIGHEVGHAVLGHGAVTGIAGHSSRQSQEHELAADAFMIDRMVWDEMSQWNFYNAITQLLNNWIKWETGVTSMELGSIDYVGEGVRIQDDSSTHPPMVLRLLCLIDAFLSRFPDYDTTNFYVRLRSRIHLVDAASG